MRVQLFDANATFVQAGVAAQPRSASTLERMLRRGLPDYHNYYITGEVRQKVMLDEASHAYVLANPARFKGRGAPALKIELDESTGTMVRAPLAEPSFEVQHTAEEVKEITRAFLKTDLPVTREEFDALAGRVQALEIAAYVERPVPSELQRGVEPVVESPAPTPKPALPRILVVGGDHRIQRWLEGMKVEPRFLPSAGSAGDRNIQLKSLPSAEAAFILTAFVGHTSSINVRAKFGDNAYLIPRRGRRDELRRVVATWLEKREESR